MPLVAWAAKLDDSSKFKTLIDLDVSFTHPNDTVKQAVFIWSYSVKLILNGEKDYNFIFDTVCKMADDFDESDNGEKEILSWLQDAKTLFDNY